MLFLALVSILSQFQTSNAQTLDANGISLAEKAEALEVRLLTPGAIDFGVTPCSNLLLDNPGRGEQTAAEWLRIIFHDSVTADVSAGTGGLDASIGYESNRDENIGVSFVNATLNDFNLHSSIYRSISDVIALGVAVTMLSCDAAQPSIKLKAGRVDATGPGPAGVPGPFDSLAFATNAFAKAGFNQTEMIQSVACGHSIGAVHRANFPDIIDDTFITTGTDGNATFDTTPFDFDNKNVVEYITQTGNRGGPLVIAPNVTARSDFRIFNSDKNVTIKALQTPATFRTTCLGLFEKMLNTVPRTVTLSDPFTKPRQWLLREGHYDLDSTNTVRYIGLITTASKTVTAPNVANFFFGTTGGGNTGVQVSGTQFPHLSFGASVIQDSFGPIIDYKFNATLGSNPFGVTSFNIATAGATTTAVYTKALNPNFFIIGSKTFKNGQSWIIRAAVRSTLVVSGTPIVANIYYPVSQQASVASKYLRETASMTVVRTQGSFTVFQVVLTQSQPAFNGAIHLDVKVGSTFSAKADANEFVGTCTNSPMTTC